MWPALLALLGGTSGAAGASSAMGGLGGLGGMMSMGGNPDAPGVVSGGGQGGGLLMDMGGQGESGPPGAGFMDKLMMGSSKDMSGYGQAKDVSEYAKITKLLAMSNQMKRQQSQRQPAAPYMYPALRSLLGG